VKSNWSDLFVRPILSSYRDTNPQHRKFLFFYYNPDDPRLFVPKRLIGNPFTLNFAQAWKVLVTTVMVIIVSHDTPALLHAI
jgi:hypothetical protein